MRFFIAALVTAIALAVPGAAERAPAQSAPSAQAIRELDAAFNASHNLDHPQALARVRHAVSLDPGSSRVHRGLASIIWLQQVFERGTMTVDHYLGSISTSKLALPRPDPALSEEFRGALARAIELAERRMRERPNDVEALFDAGAAYGVQASYLASVQGGITGAFRAARRAFDTQSEVLRRDAARAPAGLIVGAYRYLVASQPMYVRFFALLAGFPGDKDKALALLEAASHDPMSRVEGKTALVIIYSREGRHTEAMRLARELAAELPRNRLFVLEEGAAAIRAGRAAEAEAVLTRGLKAFESDPRPKIRSEHAIWLYKRGLARLNQNHPTESLADLTRALTLQPAPWVEGHIQVTIGKLADLAGRRREAVAAYTKGRAKCAEESDSACVNEAGQFLKQPFSFDRRNP